MDPLQRKILIEETKIFPKRKKLLSTWKTKDIGPIIESNDDNVLILCETRLHEPESGYHHGELMRCITPSYAANEAVPNAKDPP